MNENLFNDLYNASEYYRICNAYDEIIKRYNTDIWHCEEKYGQIKSKKDSPLVINIASILIGLFLFLQGYAFVISDHSFIKIIGVVLWILGSLALIIVPIFNTIRCKKSVNKYAKIADNLWYSELGPIVAEDKKNIKKAKGELTRFKLNNRDCVEFLPQEYRNYQATSYMALAVGKRRADTFKEAANLYEEQLHRWRIEQINEEIAYQNMAINNNLSNIYNQQIETNKRLRNIEDLEFYNMWYK